MTAPVCICPGCGSIVPDDENTWILAGKFYCSEMCCRRAGAQ